MSLPEPPCVELSGIQPTSCRADSPVQAPGGGEEEEEEEDGRRSLRQEGPGGTQIHTQVYLHTVPASPSSAFFLSFLYP